MSYELKRVYAPCTPDDGVRVLVDRLWPRGLSKTAAQLDLWLREAAPSPALRKWFDHDPARWAEFTRRYHAELAENDAVLTPLRQAAGRGRVTLLYAARDEQFNHAAALRQYLLR